MGRAVKQAQRGRKRAGISHLASFVEKRATAAIANTAFGKLVGARPEADIKPKFRRRPSGDPAASATSLGIQSVSGVRPPDGTSLGQPALRPVTQGSSKQVSPLSCLFCNGAHSLERCFKFRAKTFDERKEFVSTKKLRTNCLGVNHFARRCTMAKAGLLHFLHFLHLKVLKHLSVVPPNSLC